MTYGKPLHFLLLFFCITISPCTLFGMATINHFKELQPTHDALISVNNIMRKYHQKNLEYSKNQTECDGLLLQNILLKNNVVATATPQKNIIINEILGLLLFDLFFWGHYKDTITYINTIIPMLPEVEKCLVFIPIHHLQNNNLYTYLENNWTQLPPHQKLIFHLLLSIPYSNFYFDQIADCQIDTVIKRLILFQDIILIRALPQTYKNFISYLQAIAQEQIGLNCPGGNVWKTLNKKLNKNNTAELIMSNDFSIGIYKNINNDEDAWATLLKYKGTRISLLHLKTAVKFGAENAFLFLLDTLLHSSINQEQVKKIILSLFEKAMIHGNKTIINTLSNMFPEETTNAQLSDNFIASMMKFDKSDAVTLSRNLAYSALCKKRHKDLNLPEDKKLEEKDQKQAVIDFRQKEITQFIDNVSWVSPNEMEKIYQAKIPTLSFPALLQKIRDQHNHVLEPPLLKINAAAVFLEKPHPETKSLLQFIHTHFDDMPLAIDEEIIKKLNTLTKQLKKTEPIGYDMVHEELKGILLRHLFFTKPINLTHHIVSNLLRKITILQKESLTQSFNGAKNADKKRYASLTYPHITFIYDNLPKHITCVETFKSIDTFIDFVFLYHTITHQTPFFTLTMFKNTILKLEDEYTSNPIITIIINFLNKFPTYLHQGSKLTKNVAFKDSLIAYLTKNGKSFFTPAQCAALAGDELLWNLLIDYNHQSHLENLIPYAIAGGNNTIISSSLEKLTLTTKDPSTFSQYEKNSITKLLKTAIEYHHVPTATHLIATYQSIIDPATIPFCIVANRTLWKTILTTKMLTQDVMDKIRFYAHINIMYFSLFAWQPKKCTTHESIIIDQQIFLQKMLSSNDKNIWETIEQQLTPEQRTRNFSQVNTIYFILKKEDPTFLEKLLTYVPDLFSVEGLTPPQMLQIAIKNPNPHILAKLLEYNKNTGHYNFTLNDCVMATTEITRTHAIHNLLKHLAKNHDYEKLMLIFELIDPKSTDLNSFFYEAARCDVQFFTATVEKLQKKLHANKKIKLESLKIIPSNSTITKSENMNVLEAACHHNNTQLVEYLSNHNMILTTMSYLDNPCKKNNLPLIKTVFKKCIHEFSCTPKNAHSQNYRLFLRDIIMRCCELPFENTFIEALLTIESEDLYNPCKRIYFIHELIKIPTASSCFHDVPVPSCLHDKTSHMITLFLQKNPTSITLTNKKNENALHVAAIYDSIATTITPLLISAGVPLTIPNHPLKSPLYTAMQYNNVNFIKAVLPFVDPSYLNEKDLDAQGNTLLFEAINKDRYDIAQLFISHGANMTIKNTMQTSPLNLLHIKKNVHLAQIKKAENKNLDLFFNKDLITPLGTQNIAHMQKHIEQINDILKNEQATIHNHTLSKTHNPQTLEKAIKEYNKPMIIQFINAGYPLVEKHENTQNPLFSLFGKNWDNDIVDLIITTHPLVNLLQIEDPQKKSLFDAVVAQNDLTLLKKITRHPTFKDFSNKKLLYKTLCNVTSQEAIEEIMHNTNHNESIAQTNTLLYKSIKQGNLILANYIIHNHKNLKLQLNEFNKNNITPIMLAIEKGYQDIVERMCSLSPKKPFYTKCTKSGASMLHIAAELGMTKSLAFCLAQPCNLFNVNTPITTTKNTALHIAATHGKKEIVTMLLQHGADTTIKNRKGLTPAMCALKNKHLEIEELLNNHIKITI